MFIITLGSHLKLQSRKSNNSSPTTQTYIAVYTLMPYNTPYSNTRTPLILPQSSHLLIVYLADLPRTSYDTLRPLQTSPNLE